MEENHSISVLSWQSGALVLTHLALGWLGFHLYQRGLFVALGWPAIGVEVVLMCWWGWRQMLPALFLASVLLHFWVWEAEPSLCLVLSLGEAGEITLGAALLGYGLDWQKGLHSLQQLRRGVMVALFAPVLGAVMGLLGIWIASGGMLGVEVSGRIFFNWWMRSVVGFLVMAPAMASWHLRPLQVFGPHPREGAVLAVFVLALVLVVFTSGVFPGQIPIWMGILVALPLLWCGGRCGLFLTSHLGVLVLGAASFAALLKVGVFAHLGNRDLLATWWMLLNICASSGVVLAILQSRSLKQARALKATRNRLKFLVHDSPLALVEWDLEFRIRSWSRQAERIFGFPQDQVLGSCGLDFFVADENRSAMREMLLAAIHGRQGLRSSHHDLTASGHRILCDWYASPVIDECDQVIGVVCLVEDISDWETSALALRESEKRFQSVAEILPQAIAYFSPGWKCLSANSAFCGAYPLSRKDSSSTLESIVGASFFARIQQHLDCASSGERVRFLETLENEEGVARDLDWTLLPDFGEDRTIRGFFSVATDITEYRAAERERFALEAQILQTQKLESLGLLSNHIAHEFNNRLCGILGNADMAHKDIEENPERAKTALLKSVAIAKDASELCQQLYVYSGHGSGQKTLARLNPILREMRRLLELTLPRQIRFSIQLEKDLPEVLLDASQIRQAVVNLVQNAAQSIGEQRGTIFLQSRKTKLEDCTFVESFFPFSDPQVSLVEIRVEDSGQGIAASDLPRIFEPFFAGHSGGRGLGLAGVLGIIHGHGGGVGVHSVVGEGSRISLFLPLP